MKDEVRDRLTVCLWLWTGVGVWRPWRGAAW